MNTTFRVAFYNVENLFDTIDNPDTDDDFYTPESEIHWDMQKYSTKIDRLAEVIVSLSADEGGFPAAIGMAEIENRSVLADLCSQSSILDAGYLFVHEDSPDERGIDVALLYRSDLFMPLSHEALHVDLGEDHTRDILHVEGMLGDNRVHFFVNHWPSRREGQEASEPKRLAAAHVLLAAVDSVRSQDPGARIIIMGDFNDEPANKSISEVLAAGIPGQDENALLYNLAYKAFLRGEGTYYYRYEHDWNLFDQFIISANLLGGDAELDCPAKGMTIHRRDFMLYRTKDKVDVPNRTLSGTNYFGGYSDHLPVYIDLVTGEDQ